MKKILCLFLSLILFFSLTGPIFAQGEPNNRFGIYISSESDLTDAANLVNSNGGEWGYVAMVIREDERDVARWQRVFDRMKALKIIPIIRIATTSDGENWKKPTMDSAKDWAKFLGSLRWPTKNRYVILFNEPNHSIEWGGDINPDEYTHVARRFWEELQRRSFDFFVLPAGMDQAATDTKTTMDEAEFLDKMHKADPLIFTLFGGWTSHSYPNPGFTGSPTDQGRGTINGFKWEMSYIKKFGVKSDLPIFITETGWVYNARTKNQIEGWYKTAFENVWNDPQIQAVTPFLLSYSAPPFDTFSWKNPANGQFYSQYDTIKSLPKEAGQPEQEEQKVVAQYPIIASAPEETPLPTETPSFVSQIVSKFAEAINGILLRLNLKSA